MMTLRALSTRGAVPTVTLVLTLAGACTPSPDDDGTAPTYTVTADSAVMGTAAEDLAEALDLRVGGVPVVPLDDDGAIRFVDPERFQRVPTKAVEPGGDLDESRLPVTYEGFDFAAIEGLAPIEYSQALSTAEQVLATANLSPAEGTPSEGHIRFEAVDVDGTEIANVALDTQVNYTFKLDGRDVVGPGARVKLAFDSEANPVQVVYALRGLERGDNVPIIPASEADQLAQEIYDGQAAQMGAARDLQIGDRDLVYYAPPLSQKVQALFPHYRYSGGTIQIGDEIVELQTVLIPAVEDAPMAELALEFDAANDNQLTATSTVTGGTPPYTYSWGSSTQEINPEETATMDRIVYFMSLFVRDEPLVTTERVTLVVTDANGLIAKVSEEIAVASAFRQPAPLRTKSVGIVDAGAEASGECAGLPHSRDNAYNFRNTMLDFSVPVQFIWTENNAWEQDFKDPTKSGGDDVGYVDDVDVVFFSGHGSPNGFSFCDSTHDDSFVDHADSLWGDRDLEWIGIDACSVLAVESGGMRWWQRWDEAFGGVHQILSFQTVNYDTKDEGRLWANYMLGIEIPMPWWPIELPGLRVREAWAQMSTDKHGSDVEWAVMGVYGPDGLTTFNDYFWGEGPVGPDLRGSSINGYWHISGPS